MTGPVPLLGGHDWTPAAIPASLPGVSLVRLHLDPGRRSSTSLVRFPPGWSRPAEGHYPVGEEIVVLAGELIVSGVGYGPGDYGWLPPGAPRVGSATPPGALCLAWFSGPPAWTPGPPAGGAPPGRRLTLSAAVPGDLRTELGTTSYAEVPPDRADRPLEVVSLTDWTWALVPAGGRVRAVRGPVLLRS